MRWNELRPLRMIINLHALSGPHNGLNIYKIIGGVTIRNEFAIVFRA